MVPKKGFTLLELMMVILIVTILSAVGLIQFIKMVEKNRTAEAKRILGNIRVAEQTYFLNNSVYTTSMDAIVHGAPTSCVPTHYFSYTVNAASANDFTAVATRCSVGSGGKEPGVVESAVYTITVDAVGTWAGTEPP